MQPSQNMRDSDGEIRLLRAAVEELKLLNTVAVVSSGAGSVEAMLGLIIDESLKVVHAEQGSIVLLSGDTETSLKTFVRQDDQSSLRHSYHVGAHILGAVVYDRRALLIEDLAADPRFTTTEQERGDIRSILCVPIINQGRLIGAMMMVNKKGGCAFSADDQRLLTILSAQTGQLIINAQLREEGSRKKEELTEARLEAQKWRELDELKSRFFADISHEFRTPLTLILGPIEQLITEAPEGKHLADYRLIRRSAHRLLRLINDVLDLSRLEAHSMKLHLGEGDLVPAVRMIVESFRSWADQAGITLCCVSATPSVRGYFDREKVETVLSNLLSNALKFTPAGGAVTVELTPVSADSDAPRQVSIKVIDSGRGIPADKVAHLFDRYYQVEDQDRQTGSGLGLALCRGLVELHHGTITVMSGEHGGSSFEVRLPIDRSCYSLEGEDQTSERIAGALRPWPDDEIPEPLWQGAAHRPEGVSLPVMLIAEDDTDMRRYLCDNLRHSFTIVEASDGDLALKTARDTVPDVVISDVSMPVMDGLELCRHLKNDERTCHIPFLLLTASAGASGRLTGLESGADDYLIKPFDWRELEARVRNLVEGRKRLREHFTQSLLRTPSPTAVPSMDASFLTKVRSSIERCMGDETFSVEDLARDVSMSYSQLHRKLSALLNQSPNQLIRSMRLHRAKDLIERRAGTISEIAYTVGFGSPAYLTKCFREQFGIVPSEVRHMSDLHVPGA